jgi:hypothetical protein
MFEVDNPFWIKEQNEEGWTGRAKKGIVPKWKKYGHTNHCMVVGDSTVGVVVEDGPSACAVSATRDYAGVALLGTNLTSVVRQEILGFNELIICLDPDAATKSMKLYSSLVGLVKVRVVVPPNDLKYYKPDKIMEILDRETITQTATTD